MSAFIIKPSVSFNKHISYVLFSKDKLLTFILIDGP